MSVEEALWQLGNRALEHLPEFLLAVVLIIAGMFVGWLLRLVAEALLRSLGLDGFADRSGLGRALKNATRMETTLTQLVGRIVFWTVLLYFLASALRAVGLGEIAGFITAVARFVPKVLGAVLLTAGGLFAGKLVRELITEDPDRREAPEAWERLGQGTQVAVVVAAVLLALILLGLDLTPLVWLIGVAMAVAGVLAAVGLGPALRIWARNRLVARRLRKQIKNGNLVRAGEVEGFVVSIGDEVLSVQTTEGMVYLPNASLEGRPLAILTNLPDADLTSLEMP